MHCLDVRSPTNCCTQHKWKCTNCLNLYENKLWRLCKDFRGASGKVHHEHIFLCHDVTLPSPHAQAAQCRLIAN
jgi:hypothetical protein